MSSDTASALSASSPSAPSGAPSAVPGRSSSPDSLRETVLAAFTGKIEPVQLPATYRLGIVLVALVMMILPLIYLAIIGAVCYGVYLHAVNDVTMLSAGKGRGKLIVFIAYLAPMIVGPILILFMFKPLLARRPPGPKSQSLDPDTEPLVYAFVNRVCEAVGAPRPREINIDCQVNASASFRRGLISMLGNDLVLTLGLPLIAGLDTRQLAGVLAHEFGHFAQSAGMRLTYIIRSISDWFTRVVYERDEWDQRLVDWSKSLDIRFGWVLYLTRFFVWLTRRILWVLMNVGHAVSGYMLRQMEFDADRHQARLAGSAICESTLRRIRALSIADGGAQSDLSDFYREGRLADDFPRLVLANVNQFPPEAYRHIDKLVAESSTGWFDTHPSDKDRIASAEREAAPGIFQLELPATQLFRDFDTTSRTMTLVFYRNVLGDDLKVEVVKPLDELLAGQQQEQAAFKALNRFFQAAYRVDRPLPLADAVDAASTAESIRPLLESARGEMREGLAKYKDICQQFDDAGQEARPALAAQLEPFEHAAGRRVSIALRHLDHPDASGQIPEAPQLRAEGAGLLPSLKLLNANLNAVVTLFGANAILGAMLQQLSKKSEDQGLITAIRTQMSLVFNLLSAARKPFESTRYPFSHARAETSIGEFLLEKLPDAENPFEVYHASDSFTGSFHRLRARTIGCLCAIAEQVEASLGLDPFPEPKEEDQPAGSENSE